MYLSLILFAGALSLIPTLVYAQQNVTNTTTIAAGPNVSVLFSANSTGFDPLTQLGTLMMVGQVKNNGTEPSENTNVTTELLDFNGTLAGFNTARTVPATIPPNGTANFQTTFTDQDVIGGTGNVLFYQHTPDNGGETGRFLGFVPPPFLLPGAGAALAGAGVPLGAGGGFGAVGGGGGIGGGFSGGGGDGGGGTTINQEFNQDFFNCIINQANLASNTSGEVDQSNIAICNQFKDKPVPIGVIGVVPLGEPGGPANDDGSCNDGQESVDNKCPPKQPEPEPECDPNYEGCVPLFPPDVNCGDPGVGTNIEITGDDPHGLDADNDGIGCNEKTPPPSIAAFRAEDNQTELECPEGEEEVDGVCQVVDDTLQLQAPQQQGAATVEEEEENQEQEVESSDEDIDNENTEENNVQD